MDETLTILDALSNDRDLIDAWPEASQAVRIAAAALRASQERERELMEALEQSILQIEYLQDKFQATASGNAVTARARAILDKHKEKA